MLLAAILWMLVWGGMFTGIYNLPNLGLSDPFAFFQGLRAFFPLLSLYLCILWLIKRRSKFPFLRDPLGFLFLYCLVGVITSLLLSPSLSESLYAVGIYLAPLFVVWAVFQMEKAKLGLRLMIYLNYAVFFFLTFALFPTAVRIFRGQAAFSAWYTLPFGFGQVTKNGAGRYALIVIIVSAMRLMAERRRWRWIWLGPLFASLFLLMQTQSRTALLGLAVISFLYFLMRGINWRFIFASPIVIYIIYFAGYKLRAQGRLDFLVDLSGRETTWSMALKEIGRSPFLGWGFDADRILLNAEHMHNSYLHALIQVGIIGALFFVAALAGIWLLIVKTRLLEYIRELRGKDQTLLMEAVLIVGFLTSRSFFESTAAFYGVDLLLLIPAMAYISLVAFELREAAPEMSEVT